MWKFVALLALVSSAAHAGPEDRQVIQACNAVERQYGKWALGFRKLLEKDSTDVDGRIDASLLKDVNFALVSARDFVHMNIKFVQQAPLVGKKPTIRDCQEVSSMARTQIEQYVRALLSEVHPADRWGRDTLRAEFRMGLRESTSRFQGY